MHIEAQTVRAFIEVLASEQRKLVNRDIGHPPALERRVEVRTADALSAAIAFYAIDPDQCLLLQCVSLQWLSAQVRSIDEHPARMGMHADVAAESKPPPERSWISYVAIVATTVALFGGATWWSFAGNDGPALNPTTQPAPAPETETHPALTAEPEPQPAPTPKPQLAHAPEPENHLAPAPGPTPASEDYIESPQLLSDGSTQIHVPLDEPQPVLRPHSFGLLALFLLLSALTTSFGVTVLLVPKRTREVLSVRRAEMLARRNKAMHLRRKSASSHISVPYYVERYPPFPDGQLALLDDAATILARLGVHTGGRQLDVDRSLARTLDRGGQPTAVMRPHMVPHELLVLVDIETGDHPFLAGVEWLLRRWHSGGVRFRRYDFKRLPSVDLREHASGRPVHFTSLGRATSGTPLLLFSRGVMTNETQWLDEAARAWPQRIFVDLDPRAPREQDVLGRRLHALMTKTGFERVPFSPSGLMHAAQHLAGRTPSESAPDIGLRPLSEVQLAIESWLAVATCVPDPTWAQLEAFRREFPELERELPHPAYVQRALERAGHDPLKDGGKRLALSDQLLRELQASQILKDRQAGLAPEQQLIARAHSVLLDQLRLTPPDKDSSAYPMWSLKCASHQAELAPAKADELFADFLVHPLRFEMLAMVGNMKWLAEQLGDSPPQLSRIDAEAWADEDEDEDDPTAGKFAIGGGVRWGQIPIGSMRPSLPELGLSLVAGLLAVGIGFGVAERKYGDGVLAPTGQVPMDLQMVLPDIDPVVESEPDDACDFTVPPIRAGVPVGGLNAKTTGESCRIVATALADTDTPMRLVGLTGGEYTMGSNAEADETAHRVTVSRFAVCETEVSIAQYFAVTGERPSDCRWGCRASDPVHDVNWEDAARFMNALTRRENARRTEKPLTACYDERTWAWDRECTGYRLPTEAEWEYAARGGTRTAYSFVSTVDQLCKYGHVKGCEKSSHVVSVSAMRANNWGLFGIHGNVWEWVFDVYDARFYERSPTVDPDNDSQIGNPNGIESTVLRSLRGGSFIYPADFARSAYRGRFNSGYRSGFNGFRCALGRTSLAIDIREELQRD